MRPDLWAQAINLRSLHFFIEQTSKLFHFEYGQEPASSNAALSEATDTADLREKFVAILGHDLRNPVAAIQAGTTLLAKASLDDRSSRIITQMAQSCERMSYVIEDILRVRKVRHSLRPVTGYKPRDINQVRWLTSSRSCTRIGKSTCTSRRTMRSLAMSSGSHSCFPTYRRTR